MLTPAPRPGALPPFHEIDEYVFQDMCRDLLAEEQEIATSDLYGTRGQRQHGIDVLAHRMSSDGIEVGQCRRYKTYSATKIRGATDDFLHHWPTWKSRNVKRFILFVACDLGDTKQRDQIIVETERFREIGIVYEAWGAATIRRKLRPHPVLVRNYLLHEFWVDAICGRETSLPVDASNTASTVALPDTSSRQPTTASLPSDIERELEDAKEQWRQGAHNKALQWLDRIRNDLERWQALGAVTQAKVLRFQATVELDRSEDTGLASSLADQAASLDPSENIARLRAIIAFKQHGPRAALVVLANENDLDSLNLRAALHLELNETDRALELLSSLGAETTDA